jgi:predicted nucleic acid-binding protein
MERSRSGGRAIAVLVDTSALYALTDRGDGAHRSVRTALKREREAVIVPQVVLPEVCYLLNTRGGPPAEKAFLEGLAASDWGLEPLTEADFHRAIALLDAYRDANIGFVDAALVAVAERLGVTRIYTLDRRDFSIIRPTHVERFVVLP